MTGPVVRAFRPLFVDAQTVGEPAHPDGDLFSACASPAPGSAGRRGLTRIAGPATVRVDAVAPGGVMTSAAIEGDASGLLAARRTAVAAWNEILDRR